jgi:release factor glutamine methyltransferase
VASARARIVASGVPAAEAALDAELLALDALGWDRITFIARAIEAPPPGFGAAFEALVARREQREPVAYIRGRQEFWGRDFHVGPGVLIPRPETEGLVEHALAWVAERSAHGEASGLRIADIGTGSGCLAVTFALEVPGAHVTATDTSQAALATARGNAARLGAAVAFVEGAFLASLAGPFDLIVSNPPYVAERDRPSLQPEVATYEPGSALFAGPDGLDVLRALIPIAAPALDPRGRLMVELGAGQAEAVSHVVAAVPGLALTAIRRDLQGIARIAIIDRHD